MFTAFTWVFAISVLASFAESYGIGANDLANAFGTSVGAKAITYFQAVCIAAICEVLGAFLLGANTTATIKDGVANSQAFASEPQVLMYGMLVVMIVSAVWDILACTLELQVSATHTTVGAILGMTLVTKGSDAVIWHNKNSSKFPPVNGFVSILLGWIISPLVAMAFTSLLFFILRTFVLRAKDSVKRAVWCLPFAVWVTTFAISASVIQTGTNNGNWNVSKSTWPWIAVVVGSGCAVLSLVFVNLLTKRIARLEQEREKADADAEQPKTPEELAAEEDAAEEGEAGKQAKGKIEKTPSMLNRMASSNAGTAATQNSVSKYGVKSVAYDIYHCLDKNDPHYNPKTQAMWDNAEVFDWRAEEIFKYLQVFTACVLCFAHGANDVANAMGPFSLVYYIWENSAVPSEKVNIKEWVLAYGGVAISIGLATYGWRIMRLLSAKSIKLSNSRGFIIDLSVSLVVIVCARFGFPVSTPHLAMFSTVAVGCFEGRKGVNLRMVFKTIVAMLITIGVAMGLTSGVCAFTMFAPYIPGPAVLPFAGAPPPPQYIPSG